MRYRFKYLKSLIIFWRNKLVLGLTRAKDKVAGYIKGQQQNKQRFNDNAKYKENIQKNARSGQDYWTSYRKGANDAAQKQAYAEGAASITSPKKQGGAGAMFSSIGTGLGGLEKSINHAEKVFGFGGGKTIGGGLDFGLGFGGSEQRAKPVAMRERIVRPNGTVIIREPVESKKAKMGPRKNFFEEIEDNNPF